MTLGAVDIDRKLCLTAALVGAVTRKDLAAAFRKVNPHTSFDVERAHKWLQGRARPREGQLYEDWARLLDIDRSGSWIADCAVEDLADLMSARAGVERDVLLRRAQAFAGDGGRPQEAARGDPALSGLIGTYVCYSHAWSPYFPGRIIRGVLGIRREPGQDSPLGATYAETLPNGTLVTSGRAQMLRQALHVSVMQPEGLAAFLLSLFPPTPPVSVLGGLMCGPTVIASEAQPSVTRIVAVRLPVAPADIAERGAYLSPGASIAEDLAACGLALDDRAAADRLIGDFLDADCRGRSDRAPIAAYRSLVEHFDAAWARRAYPVA
jgi:hypothetical protein